MNDDKPGGAAAPASEADTVQPNKPSGGWEMPEPTFQQTSGYLPQGYLEKAGLAGGPGVATTASTAPPAAGVEPQPDISEQLESGPTVAPGPALPVKQRSTGARIALIVLGLLGMVIFIAVFLAVVYYLFIAPQNGGSNF